MDEHRTEPGPSKEPDRTREQLLAELKALRAEVEALRPEALRPKGAPIGFTAAPEEPSGKDGGLSEEVLRAYERHRLAARAAGAMVYEWDLENKVVERQGLKELTGHEPKDASPDGDWWLEQVHPDDKARVKQSLLAAFKSVCPYTLEYLVKKKDGQYLRVLDQGAVLPAEAGRSKRCLGQVQDLAPYGRLRGEPTPREKSLSRVAEASAGVGVFLADAQGTVLDANDAFLRLLDCAREDLKSGGLRWTDMTPASDQASDERALAELSAGRAPAPYEKEYHRKDGVHRGVLVALAPAEDGRHSGLLVDVTERRLEQRRLRRSEANLNDFFENAAVGIHWIGADGTVLRVNRAGLEMLGCSAADYVGRHMAEFHEDRGVIADVLARLSRGESVQGVESRMRRKDGSFRHVLIDVNVLFDGGRFVHARCFTRDISSQKAAEAGLREAAASLTATLKDRDRAVRRLAAKNAVTRVLAESSSLADGGRQVLQAVCESLGWRCGVFWMVDRATRMLSCVNLWSERPFPEFERMSREVAFSPGAGLPGRVWAKGEPVWIRDVTQDANFPRRYVAASDGLHSAVAFPVRLHDETLGVMEFYSDETLAPDDDALAVMAGIGSQLGQFIERWRAEDALRESERRLRRHNEALLSLATTAVAAQGVVAENLGRITETASRTLETDRVGVWFFNETRSAIRCADLYESREHRHSSGAELKAADYPRYFKALEEERSLAAADARTDPRTSEFREGYLAPLGISSMLDAPIRVNGVLAGVVCHEHVGAARDWTPEEQQFAASIADLVALMIEARERRRADEALLEAKDFAESVIETSNVVIVQLDAEGAVRKFNQMAEVVTGYAKDEVVGRKWVEVVDARDAMPGFWRGFARLAKGGLPRVVEGAVVTKTGERRMISWVNSELREDGRLVGVMLFGTDITERRKAEEDLRRAHAELEKRVEQRTADLARTVKVLEEQIRVRQKAEAELLASRGALRALSARLESAREEERKNLSREVHDEFGQTLTAMKVEISWMNKRLGPGDAALSEKIKSLSDLIDRSIKVVRRMATDLRPGQLDDLGLVSALDWLVKDFQGRTKVACRLAVRPENISVDPETSTALFRIVQEALTNVMRHAKASNVTVDLDVGERALLRVKDDGRGITDKEASHPGSLGLLGIRERVLLCGGTFEIKGSPKKGTLLEVVLPLKSRGKRGGGKK